MVKFFPREFLNQCKNNPNEPQNIPNEVKALFKKYGFVNGLNAQVVMISIGGLDDKK